MAGVTAPIHDDPLPLQRLQSCGLPLASSAPMDRWRDEAEERARQRAAANAEMKANERRAVDDANKAMADAWAQAHANADERGFSALQNEVLGAMISNERAMWRRELRRELDALRKELNDLVRAAEPRSG